MTDPTDEDDDLLTVKQVAEKTHLPVGAVYSFIRDGSLTAVTFGPRRIRVRPADLAAFYDTRVTRSSR